MPHDGRDYFELNVREFLRLLIKQRHKMMVAAGIGILVGAVLVFAPRPKYRFASALEVGQALLPLANPPKIQALETMGLIARKLEDAYFPLALAEVQKDYPKGHAPTIKFMVRDRIVRLESEGRAESEAFHVALHKAILGRLVKDHVQIYDAEKAQFEEEIATATARTASLKERQNVLEEHLKAVESALAKATRSAGTRTDLAQSGLFLGLSLQRHALRNEMNDIQRELSLQAYRLKGSRGKLTFLQKTRVLMEPARAGYAGTPAARKMLLVLVLSCLLGLIVAFANEFAGRLRESQAFSNA